MPPSTHANSEELFRRAKELIPGGVHLSGRVLTTPEHSPLYMERGAGSHVWDVDGNEYIDYLMAYGPFLLGYAREEVNRAAMAQVARGHLLSLNHPMHLEFAQAVVDRFPGAEMAALLKTGSEATTAAVRIARCFTGRRRVARAGYHGWHDWCLPREAFVPDGLELQVGEFRPDDPASLEECLAAHPGEFAAVILAPEMIYPPSRETFGRIAEIARAHGAVFIADEVKTALRTPLGSMQAHLGVPADLTTVSKALGNGWPVAAVTGKRAIMHAAAGMHISATYHGDTAAMAAALQTLRILDEEPVTEHVWRLGQRLLDGLNEVARATDVPAIAYGEPHPPMPFLRFQHPDATTNAGIAERFYDAMFARGVLFHPRHMWFVSYAHTEEDIDRTLEAATHAMRDAREAMARRRA
jgi:glutamate-1-semialdehyde 2,1-aminomutase